jgi:hypothetical protein
LPGGKIALAGKTPLAKGGSRRIYQHPYFENLLIKVISMKTLEHYERRSTWYKGLRRSRGYHYVFREIDEYLALRLRKKHELPFLQRFNGIIDTDLGLGVVVEKIKERNGKLAPSVTSLVREKGFSPELRKKLLRLRDDVIKHHVIFTDVSGNNIVVARGKRGQDRLVIIDGLGDRLWLPVNVLSPRINRLNRTRHFDRAIAKLERIDRERRSRLKSRAKPQKSR